MEAELVVPVAPVPDDVSFLVELEGLDCLLSLEPEDDTESDLGFLVLGLDVFFLDVAFDDDPDSDESFDLMDDSLSEEPVDESAVGMAFGAGVVCSRYGDLVKMVFFFFFLVVDPDAELLPDAASDSVVEPSSLADASVESSMENPSVTPDSELDASSVPWYPDADSLDSVVGAFVVVRGVFVVVRGVFVVVRGVFVVASGVSVGVSVVGVGVLLLVTAGVSVVGVGVLLLRVGVGVVASEPEFVDDKSADVRSDVSVLLESLRTMET